MTLIPKVNPKQSVIRFIAFLFSFGSGIANSYFNVAKTKSTETTIV